MKFIYGGLCMVEDTTSYMKCYQFITKLFLYTIIHKYYCRGFISKADFKFIVIII